MRIKNLAGIVGVGFLSACALSTQLQVTPIEPQIIYQDGKPILLNEFIGERSYRSYRVMSEGELQSYKMEILDLHESNRRWYEELVFSKGVALKGITAKEAYDVIYAHMYSSAGVETFYDGEKFWFRPTGEVEKTHKDLGDEIRRIAGEDTLITREDIEAIKESFPRIY